MTGLLLRIGHDRRVPAVHPGGLLRPEPRCRTSRTRIGEVGDCDAGLGSPSVSRPLRDNLEEVPLVRNALERVFARILEDEARPGREILHRRGHPDL